MWLDDAAFDRLREIVQEGPPPGVTRPLPQVSSLPGTVGRFEVRGLLGQGGMGTVYRAFDPQFNREVAVKVLNHAGRDDHGLISRFWREARTVGSLHHPWIVTVYEVGTLADSTPYLVMERVDGTPLADWIARGDAWPMPQRVQLLRDVARAIEHAHASGIVHRDLKPSNILVDANAHPRVLDFGLARHTEATAMTLTGQFLGTPGYMAPEQVESGIGKLGPATDVFALGVILYELLTGCRPFEGSVLASLIRRTLDGVVDPPRRLNPSVPADLEAVCLRALERSPGDRYPDARVLADELDRFLLGRRVQARPTARRVRQAWQRFRRPSALLGASAMTLLAVLAAVSPAWRDRPPRESGVPPAATDPSPPAEAPSDGSPAAASSDASPAGVASFAAGTIPSHDSPASTVGPEPGAIDLPVAGEAGGEPPAPAPGPGEKEVTAPEVAPAASTPAPDRTVLAAAELARWDTIAEKFHVLTALKHDRRLTAGQLQTAAEPIWQEVDRFAAATPADATSRAIALALAGWARFLGGDEGRADECTLGASRADPASPYAPLFRALPALLGYFLGQPLPEVRWTKSPAGTDLLPPETQAMKEIRKTLEPLLQEVARATDEKTPLCRQLLHVVYALRHFQARDLQAADLALSRALGAGDTGFSDEIRWLRAHVRLLALLLPEAVEDLERLRIAWPGEAAVLRLLGWAAWCQASLDAGGGNTLAALAGAIGRTGEAIELDPRDAVAWLDRAAERLHLGRELARSEQDPRPALQPALADLVEAEKCGNVDLARLLTLRGDAALALAQAQAVARDDPCPIGNLAITTFDHLQAIGAESVPTCRLKRATANVCLADARALAHEGDAKALYEAAVRDLDAVLASAPTLAEAAVVRARAILGIARLELAREANASDGVSRAIADLDRALPALPQADPLAADAYQMRGVARGYLRDYQRSLDDLLAANERRPPAPLLDIGTLYRWQDRHDEAKTAFTGAQRILDEWSAAIGKPDAAKDKKPRRSKRLEILPLPCLESIRRWSGPQVRAALAAALYHLACLECVLSTGRRRAEGRAGRGGDKADEKGKEDQARAHREEALTHLEKAVGMGFLDAAALQSRPLVPVLSAEPRFKRLLAAVK